MHKEPNPVYGVMPVNKPADWTSHDVCNFVRRRFRIKKVGHTGTLDPKATGVLILLLGRYTKMASKFADDTKDYSGVICFGKKTSTQDAEGDVLGEKDWSHLSESDVCDAINGFKGPQKQIPPMVSALKKNGKKLYELARKGKTVEREPRDIEIFDFKATKVALPEISFFISVSKGTYVRTVADDLGERLGTYGYLKSLTRERSGAYQMADTVDIETLKKLEDNDDLAKYISKDLRF